MNLFGTGGIDLVLNSQAKSRSAGQGACTPVTEGLYDEVFVKINGERHYLWRAVDHEGEVLESYVTKKRDKKQL